jgi:N-acetylglucosamine-6-phosphate deacetylase
VRKIITGGNVVTPLSLLQQHSVIIENGKIDAIVSTAQLIPGPEDETIDASGDWIAPGLIDIHTHGGNGADTMDATHDAFEVIGQFYASCGVTSYLLTTGAAPNQDTRSVIDSFKAYRCSGNRAVPLGLHLEGPYLSKERKGAQPAECLIAPEPGEYQRWFESNTVKLMTIAPELDGAMELIKFGTERGIEFAVGHSVATYEQVHTAVGFGLRQATHTFNGMDPLHHRAPGVVGAVLSDERIYAQVIPDGVHVHPAVVKLLVKAKGIDKTILITDAIRAAGLTDGEYQLLGQPITVKSGVARSPSGSLAGSTLTMDAAVRNVIEFCGLSPAEAITMASYTPAQSLGLHGTKGYLRAGADADIVIFDQAINVKITMVGGEVIYKKS